MAAQWGSKRFKVISWCCFETVCIVKSVIQINMNWIGTQDSKINRLKYFKKGGEHIFNIFLLIIFWHKLISPFGKLNYAMQPACCTSFLHPHKTIRQNNTSNEKLLPTYRLICEKNKHSSQCVLCHELLPAKWMTSTHTHKTPPQTFRNWTFKLKASLVDIEIIIIK